MTLGRESDADQVVKAQEVLLFVANLGSSAY
jgi:hypothetical protein